ncbi:solute carrier family 23 protein [Psychrobacter sanguinis]|uniref:solute carrier family 23 protein n=1 Tax=Psychrobacter sanguinis TaxID=861445 RepID=UPI0019197798|nr:solute carrier family 23 protein [Psychrobacter sanguinis]MCC3308431.1 NCS2 family nucleobase:cation symporter [Psychrobacter sanguinis]UEC25732.1 NCS2 family nucleobase:cation symporter [Psychrobacter sanguinis]
MDPRPVDTPTSHTVEPAPLYEYDPDFSNGKWFPNWKPFQGDLDQHAVAINEYLPPGKSVMLGVQHTFAMFGATVLAPLLMGFDVNLAILMSGICTILFFIITGGRMPSYLGSSFAFIGPVIAATAYAGSGPNTNLNVALGAIMVCGIIYALVGLLVMKVGTNWIEKLMPPIVTGAIVMIIGLNLAPVTVQGVSANQFDAWMATLTVVLISSVAIFTRGMLRRLLLLVGLILSYIIYYLVSNVMGFGTPIDFSHVQQAAWFGLPSTHKPEFSLDAIILIAPIAFILVAENLGHFKAVEGMTKSHVTPYIGRGFLADGLATTLSSGFGGTGVTTYAENIGVMAVTKVYSTTIFVMAGIVAIFLGLSPKFGAIVQSIPAALLGGASIVVFGLIAVSGVKIWIDNKIDFSKNNNLIIAAVTVIMGAGNFSLHLGGFDLGGIGTATLAAILLNAFFNREIANKRV